MFMLTHLALTGVPVMLAVKPQTFMCICFQREQKIFSECYREKMRELLNVNLL